MPRSALLCAAVVAAALALVGCDKPPYLAAISINPTGASLTTIGETMQFQAMGRYQTADGNGTTSNVTSAVTWASGQPGVATISSTGLVTAVSSGSTTITATIGGVVGTTSASVSPTAVRTLSSIAVIPSQQPTTRVGESAQFIAIGTYSTAPTTVDVTDQVTWQSSDVSVATINLAGLAVSADTGTTTITAIGTASDGSVITGTSTLTVSSTLAGPASLPQLSVYEVGLGTGTVSSSPVGVSCTAANAAACTGNFPVGTVVTLTETPANGSTFGGWSANCATATATTCTITMNSYEPVGAIFN